VVKEKVTKPNFFTPFPMNKYIQDSIRNNLRSVISPLTVPQQKAVSEVVRGLFTVGEPILSHLAQDKEKTAKKQSEKYSYHLGNVSLEEKIKDFALRKVKHRIRKNTIIAYDLSDISKESSYKMEKIRRVFDGSKRRVTNGFVLHGVGINGILTSLEVHDDEQHTQNQTRKEIIRKTKEITGEKGIWVFDRGNDHRQFFFDLRHSLNLRFICRLKRNRQVVIKETGEIIRVEDVPEGKYEVFLLNTYNTKPDTRKSFTLIIKKHLGDKEPIRLLSSLPSEIYSLDQLVTMYLERWGVENIFRRVKTKFNLERIRVLNYQRFINLVALIQFAVIISTLLYNQIQTLTASLVVHILKLYKRFLSMKSLTFNVDSFITFMRNSLEPLVHRKKKPPDQLSLLSWRQVGKLGII
jgi:hypothetical protein